ncbi:hypothetical protein UC8_46840 [Roseimaritima ulvae]|uniref:Uncharacterized protein n=1 Tax=Roseimaritima ulvae TaxID=980254 RepID=A0A5B9QXA5_9BACT|nr:hypothetical protein UC8_46840 [Roseimaritima ulvae]
MTIPKNLLPAKYANPETSELTATIPSGENELVFALQCYCRDNAQRAMAVRRTVSSSDLPRGSRERMKASGSSISATDSTIASGA